MVFLNVTNIIHPPQIFPNPPHCVSPLLCISPSYHVRGFISQKLLQYVQVRQQADWPTSGEISELTEKVGKLEETIEKIATNKRARNRY